MGYGIILTQEDIEIRQNEYYIYLKALIKAEQLNPEEDWDNDRELKLLRRIAIGDLTKDQRIKLVFLLTNENIEDD